MTFRRTLARTIVRNLTCVGLLAGSFLGMQALIGDGFMEMAPHVATPISAASPVAALLAKHDCWTGEAPADMQGVIPGHVVVTVDGVTRIGGGRMVEKALGQIFDGEDHGLRVSGFCR